MKYKLQFNQYIPRKSKSLPSGMPACATYWYITDEKGRTINFKTLKPYRGKEMSNYAIHSKTEAESFLDYLNSLNSEIKLLKPTDYVIQNKINNNVTRFKKSGEIVIYGNKEDAEKDCMINDSIISCTELSKELQTELLKQLNN